MINQEKRPSFGIYEKLENIILTVMILLAILTYSIALLNNYSLFLSDYIGIGGLMAATIISKWKKDLFFYFLFFLLFIGMLNLASFVYFFNVFIKFGYFGKSITPGIQLYSFFLFFVLVLFRRPKLISIYKSIVGDTEQGRIMAAEQNINYFRKRFELLSDEEISSRLTKELSIEAEEALLQIMDDRKKNRPRN